ncbi:MAG: c-type cytochrome [Opitutaceae bacterium]|nr:c-type cytochrome [Opitutaceae bacterium]
MNPSPHRSRWAACAFLALATAAHAARFSGEPEIQAHPLAPEAALKAFRVEPGLRIELVASEPMITDPVDIAFDERGRMFVVENNGYNRDPKIRPRSRIKRLEDTDGDGRMDHVALFADDVDYAQGVLCVRGGLLVTSNTAILLMHDDDDDGRADRTETLFTVAPALHTDRQMSAPRRAPDNWVYLNLGLFKQELTPAGAPDRRFTITSNFRWHPGTAQFGPASGAGQFGQAIDDWGRRFFSQNRNPGLFAVLARDFLDRNPAALLAKSDDDVVPSGGDGKVYPLKTFRTTASAHAGTFTAACGAGIYRGDLLGPDFAGDLFVCEPTGSLVTRWKLDPAGASFKARRVHPTREFLASTDEWFRPVNIHNGPDGALYVVDMYRRFLDGSRFFPDDFVAANDMAAGSGHGRIYRIVPEATPRARRSAPVPTDAAGRVALLEHRNGWHRDTAQRLLVEARDASVVPALEALLGKSRFAPARLHALGVLEGLNRIKAAHLEAALADAEPRVVEFALWFAPRFVGESAAIRRRVVELADSEHPRVRFAALLVAGGLTGAETERLLARAAARDAADPWMRTAILSSPATARGAVLASLLSDPSFTAHAAPGSIEIAAALAAVLATGGEAAELKPAFAALANPAAKGDWWRLAVLRGLADGLRRQPVARLPKSIPDLLATPPAELAGSLEGVRRIAAAAETVLGDRERPVAERLAAIPFLEHMPRPAALAFAGPLTHRSEPPEVQRAAIDAFRHLPRGEVSAAFYRHLAEMGATARAAAIQYLQQNPAELLKNIKAGRLNPSLVDAMGRWLIMNSASEEVRALGRDVFGTAEDDRKKLVRRYAAALPGLAGAAERGRAVFTQTCAVCHRFRGEGADVGPDITDVRIKTPDMLLSDILDPNNAIEPRWEAVSLTADGGRNVVGMVVSESDAAVVIRNASGTETLPRRAITASAPLGLSLMPQGLEAAVDEARMADLIAYLRSDPDAK